MFKNLWKFITGSLRTRIIVLITGVLSLMVIIFVIFDVMTQRQMLEARMFEKGEALAVSGAATIGHILEDAIVTGRLTAEEVFDENYQPIPGTNPVKYHTAFDSFTDANIVAVQDAYLEGKDVRYAVTVDRNSYVPTHNSIYSQALTGNYDTDLANNRTKRRYEDFAPINNAAQNVNPILREIYVRDTGEVTWNISSPIWVNGRHWGAFLVGFSLERSKEFTRMAVQRVAIGAIILIVATGAIAAMVAGTISHPIVALRDSATILAQGDLTKGIALKARNDEVGELVAALESVIAAWRGIIGGLRDDALRLSTTAAELAASSEELSRTTAAQSNEIGRTASAVEEMATSIREVAQNAEKAAQTSALSSQRAEGGGKLTYETASALERADRSMQQLRARSQEIGKIVHLIQEIAAQTNILALNAAIEAAGAGVAGARFDVVAEEIRQLAGRTSQATGEIADLINAVQAETQTAAEAISKSTAMAKESGNSLSDIVASSASVNDMVHTISAATSEQSLAGAEIASSVETMVNGSQQTALATRETAQIGVELSSLAERLKEAASRFKV
ncbi:MAG: HAMP domain-containing protein [Anaerolineae bacterium]|nr:HAMP domain-containing protein [Anaerolineae bacterium]